MTCSIDYNKDAPTTKRFFASVQNKLHYTVHGHTAAELIASRARADQPHMGLTTWEGSPNGKILPSDVTIGKNYLTRDELEDLGRLVNVFLDLAESRARRRIPMTMEDWAIRLDAFLNLDDREILDGAGRVSTTQADEHALSEFKKFRIIQDRHYISDFDRLEQQVNTKDDEGGGKKENEPRTPQRSTYRPSLDIDLGKLILCRDEVAWYIPRRV